MSDEIKKRPIDILLVEDNPGDVRLTQEAFKENNIPNKLYIVNNGEEAMFFLRREGEYKDAIRPGLILLDLNLPRKDGREVLAEIKADPDLRQIPVVILTTSESEDDVSRSYGLYANCYITKHVDMLEFVKVVEAVEHFWLSVVNLPKEW